MYYFCVRLTKAARSTLYIYFPSANTTTQLATNTVVQINKHSKIHQDKHTNIFETFLLLAVLTEKRNKYEIKDDTYYYVRRLVGRSVFDDFFLKPGKLKFYASIGALVMLTIYTKYREYCSLVKCQ